MLFKQRDLAIFPSLIKQNQLITTHYINQFNAINYLSLFFIFLFIFNIFTSIILNVYRYK